MKHHYIWPAVIVLVVISVVGRSRGDSDLAKQAPIDESLDAVQSVATALTTLDRVPVSQSVAGTLATSQSGMDAQWGKIPITRVTLSRLITVGLMQEFGSSSMLRNVFLNPRDTYISPAVRAELALIFEGITPHIQRFRELRQAANNSEFRFALESGAARQVKVPISRKLVTKADGRRYHRTTITIRDVEEQGVDMVVEKGGVLFGMSRADMPISGELLEQERFLRLEIAAALVSWFTRVGALMACEQAALLESVSGN